jgi:putative ABC transport system ATP-binding protein
VDLDCHAGEFVVVLGASGSGKSTLLNLLGGLDSPTQRNAPLPRLGSGRGRRGRAHPQYRRNSVGFVFQFYNLIPSLTARENVALITEIAPDPMSPEEALHLVGSARAWIIFPRSSPAASSSAWPSPGPSPSAPPC